MSMNTTIRVLLADDRAVVRAGIRQFMECAGDIQVVTQAGDGEAAQALIEQHHPDARRLARLAPARVGRA